MKRFSVLAAVILMIGAQLVLSGGRASAALEWIPRDADRDWASVAMSADGIRQTAAVGGYFSNDFSRGYIYTSANSGETWRMRANDASRNWHCVAMSADGKYQTAGVEGGNIYTSTDYGATWTERATDGNLYWTSVAMSADGKTQTAVGWATSIAGGHIYTSTDYGATWTERATDSSRYWTSVAMSADGKTQTAVVGGGYIYTSTDYGATWTERETDRSLGWASVAMSADGKTQTAVVRNGRIYTSADSGATWTEREARRQWCSVAMSADGTKQTAVVKDGFIYTSTDSGAIWTPSNSDRNWASVAMSADGTKQTAVNHGGRIYTCSSAAPSTWYLAEGSTAWGYSTYISIGNPTGEQLTARLVYVNANATSGSGSMTTRVVTLPPYSQTTVDPRWDLGDADFSTVVECLEGQQIAVDRTMSWTRKGAASPEAHSSTGTDAPAEEWYLPEGSSSHNFETWTLVLNPSSTEANVTLAYMTEDAGRKVLRKKVPAYARATWSMLEDIGAHDSSIKVTSDLPVVAERSQYRNDRRQGSCSIGTPDPSRDFYLPEGAVGYSAGFTTWVLVQNPNNDPVDVALTYQTGKGQVAGPAFKMPGNSRKTVKVNDTLPPDTDVSTLVHGSAPIIAERAMYWGAGSPLGEACHDSIGLDAPHTAFFLPDGQTSDGRETWTIVQNPDREDVQVEITYLTPDGSGNVTRTETISAHSRRTFNMVSHSGIAGRAAIVVFCKTGGKKVMAERSMYWNGRGSGTGTIGGYAD